MTRQSAHIFNTPVDHVKLNLPNYPKKIKHPMDLGTIKTRMLSGHYDNIDAWAADVRLVWTNAMKFNVVNTPVHRKAKEFSEQFEAKFAKIPKFIKPRSKERKRKSSSGPPKDKSGAVIANLESQLEILRKKVEQINKGNEWSSAGTPNRKKDLSKTPLTAKEKRVLRDDIFKLPSDKLGRVVDLISSAMPNGQQGDGDEIVVDFDQLSVSSLRELQLFVRQQLQLLRRRSRMSSKKRSRIVPKAQSPKRPSILESPVPIEPACPVPLQAMVSPNLPTFEPNKNGQEDGSDSDSSSSSDSGSDSDSSVAESKPGRAQSFAALSATFQNPPPPAAYTNGI